MIGVFAVGDRVRLGSLRGGVVVRHEGKLRVQFPNSGDRLLWLDGMVPDEGPDGRIYPNAWDPCERCGNPTVGELCTNCERRGTEAADAFDLSETALEHREAIARGEPSFGIHVASSIRRHGRTVEQRCARCGVVLSAFIGDTPFPPRWFPESSLWPEGAMVERHALGLGRPTDAAARPTCRPISAARRTA